MENRMGHCVRAALRSVLLVGAIALSVAYGAAATSPPQKSSWKTPHTEYGQPDLQGNWTNATITPFERPNEYGDRRALTDAEAAKLEQSAADFVEAGSKPTDPKKGIQDLPVNCRPGFSGTNCGYNNFWVDSGSQVVRIGGEKRTSIVTSPANGKAAPMTPEARARQAARMAEVRSRMTSGAADGPEQRPLGERCIMSFGSSAGPPMLPSMYNNNYQIVQSKDSVVILVEMVHDARVIRIGGQHKPSTVRTWMGDSIGHYEGDTLVVETTNFNRQQGFRGANDNLKVIERFTRVAPNQILYQFTIDDPTTFTQAWGGELNMNATRDNLYEYACHEGNYALPGILAGARAEEAAAKKSAN
jgi:hypothetical protein